MNKRKHEDVIVEVVVGGRPMNEVQQFAILKSQEWCERYNKKYR